MKKQLLKLIILLLGTFLGLISSGNCVNISDSSPTSQQTINSSSLASSNKTSTSTVTTTTTTSSIWSGPTIILYGVPYVEFVLDGTVSKKETVIEGLQVSINDFSGTNALSPSFILSDQDGRWSFNWTTWTYYNNTPTAGAFILVKDIDGSTNGLYLDSSAYIILNRTDDQTNWLYKRYELHNIYIEMQEDL